jgi:hypothetical protein
MCAHVFSAISFSVFANSFCVRIGPAPSTYAQNVFEDSYRAGNIPFISDDPGFHGVCRFSCVLGR